MIVLLCLPPIAGALINRCLVGNGTSFLATWGSTILLSTIIGAAATAAIEGFASTPQFHPIFGETPATMLEIGATGAALGAFFGCGMGFVTAVILLGERHFRTQNAARSGTSLSADRLASREPRFKADAAAK